MASSVQLDLNAKLVLLEYRIIKIQNVDSYNIEFTDYMVSY